MPAVPKFSDRDIEWLEILKYELKFIIEYELKPYHIALFRLKIAGTGAWE